MPHLLTIGTVLPVLVADQLSKWAILAVFSDAPYTPLAVTPFLNFILVYNRGVSFGLLDSGHPLSPWLLTLVNLAVIAVLLFWLHRERKTLARFSLALIIGGGCGNILDRVRIGAVVDFIDLHYRDLHFATFNVADCAITVGVGLIVLHSLMTSRSPGTA